MAGWKFQSGQRFAESAQGQDQAKYRQVPCQEPDRPRCASFGKKPQERLYHPASRHHNAGELPHHNCGSKSHPEAGLKTAYRQNPADP